MRIVLAGVFLVATWHVNADSTIDYLAGKWNGAQMATGNTLAYYLEVRPTGDGFFAWSLQISSESPYDTMEYSFKKDDIETHDTYISISMSPSDGSHQCTLLLTPSFDQPEGQRVYAMMSCKSTWVTRFGQSLAYAFHMSRIEKQGFGEIFRQLEESANQSFQRSAASGAR